MKQKKEIIAKPLVIIGGGPAGMAAAITCREQGIKAEDILILERNPRLGGILPQCIHSGFGLTKFGAELTGPEYARRYIDRVKELNIPYLCNAAVTKLTPDHMITCLSPERGLMNIKAGAVILAMGCRERSRGALRISGTRPAGIYSAGTAQQLVNLYGLMPGKSVIVLGSGDIGLIMARRLFLEGAEVKAVLERMPYSTGLKRNVVQCLEDNDIPLLLNRTVTEVHGDPRLTGVTVASTDERGEVVPGSEQYMDCDTLLLSAGLIPENELSKQAGVEIDPATGGPLTDENRETSVAGIFACGNVLHVHDVVDYVSDESEIAGKAAAEYLKNRLLTRNAIAVVRGGNISALVPQMITGYDSDKDIEISFRVSKELKGVKVRLLEGNTGRILKEQHKRIITPGQMEYFSIPARVLNDIYNDININTGGSGCLVLEASK